MIFTRKQHNKFPSVIGTAVLCGAGFLFLWNRDLRVKKINELNCCGPSCRKPLLSEEHYDKDYFEWQKPMGKEFSVQKSQWESFGARPNHAIVEFGAGTGYSLVNAPGRVKVAVEMNPHAREFMKNDLYLDSVRFAEDLPDSFFDFAFSKSVLEHVECPIQELRELHKKLKCGAKIVVGLKNEGPTYKFSQHPGGSRPGDVNNHLYTWHQMAAGNMLAASGFYIDRHGNYSEINGKPEQEGVYFYTFAHRHC